MICPEDDFLNIHMVVVEFHAEEPKTWASNSFQICEHFLSAIVCALLALAGLAASVQAKSISRCISLAFVWVTLTEVLEYWCFGDSIFNFLKAIFLFVSPISLSFLMC